MNTRLIPGKNITKFPVGTWNRLVDSAERKHHIAVPKSFSQEATAVRIKVHNGLSDIIRGGDVIGLGDVLENPNPRPAGSLTGKVVNYLFTPVVNAKVPMRDLRFGIADNPIVPKGIEKVCVSGQCWAKVDIQDAAHVSAGIVDGSQRLQSFGNIPIIWQPSDENDVSLTGVQICLLMLGPFFAMRRATVTEPDGITAGSFGEITYTDGSTEIAYLDWIHLNEDISENTKVFSQRFVEDNLVRIVNADCEIEPAAAPPGHGNNIVASITQTRPGAQGLSFRANRVTEIANDNDAVALPSQFPIGEPCMIQNDAQSSTNTLQIFPAGASDTINNGSGGASETLTHPNTVIYRLVQSGKWIS